MTTAIVETDTVSEELLAELASAAYGVALRHGLKSAFIDVELELWRELRGVLNRHEENASWPS